MRKRWLETEGEVRRGKSDAVELDEYRYFEKRKERNDCKTWGVAVFAFGREDIERRAPSGEPRML